MRADTARTDAHSGAGWGAVALVVAAGIVTAFQAGKAAIATPWLLADMGLDLSAAGWLTGIFALLGILGGIPAGALVARVGDRPVLLAGLAAALLGAVLGALAPDYAVLLGARILEGLGFLFITVAGPAILERAVLPARREFAFGLWSCFMPAGLALAMGVGPQYGDWRNLWWASAGLAAAVLAAAALLPPAPARASLPMRSIGGDALSVLGNRRAVLLALCFALYSLMFFALFGFLPVLLVERMGVDGQAAGLLAALAAAANIIGNLAAGRLLARGAQRFVLLAAACLAMGLAAPGIYLQWFGALPTLLLCILFSAVGGLVPATLISSAPLLAREAGLAPVVLGLLMQGSALGQVLGPIFVGGAIQAHGWQAAAWIVLASALAAAGAASALRAGGARAAQ
ncbi:MFS transporter [Massilia agri]|uniref:MFS transporter n=1 Tax=Massilia agri TaxID=1886785 RepID=A0ABT2AGS9_9BURK|nr:MFS transporter [Massilia agri]MCS0595401.1 MFS transporter [Massilia agri]